MQNKLTIVIPTKNRSRFLGKLLQYHSGMNFGGTILIGDASDPLEYQKGKEIVESAQQKLKVAHYQHTTNTSLIEGINLLLAEVITPYAVLSGDDDFLVPGELDRCVQFLEQNRDYSCACGQQTYVFVRRLSDTSMKVDRVTAGYVMNHENASAMQRLVEYVSHGRANNTFSVQRTDGMRERWRKASDIGLDTTKYHGCLHEVSVNVVSLIQGKQKKFQNLYHAMLRHNERIEATSVSWDIRWIERMAKWDWSKEVLQMLDWWAVELMAFEKLEKEKAYDVAEAVFLSWMGSFITDCRNSLFEKNNLAPKYRKNSKEYILQSLKKMALVRRVWERVRGGKKISLSVFLDKKSMYFEDFMPIYRELTEQGVSQESRKHAQ
ncbi:MAG: TIGR00180 family glycosyltransferase [Deltaproteobacteria bacterium]|nr:TIGR00180 family glycosyltransferase [Deltaproteobacteria bacterium]